ncbi:MAG: ABC transporter ATP-binding protein [Deltaproteobacteria bacterium]|nr:ABC transporter ATP-binding protein [Deltaproteobacteria bacterium]
MGFLQVCNLFKSYPMQDRAIPVLQGIHLEIQEGEMVGIVGASGAGKSTLLHLLGTLDQPTSGQILYEGEEITRHSPRALAQFRNRFIGFVFQFHHLLTEFSALENVLMPALIGRFPYREAVSRAKDLLDQVGLSHRMGHRPAELSGGEQQRVAIARALVLSPKLLLADEPTGNLDTHTGEGIYDLLRSIQKSVGITQIIATHNSIWAQRLDRCLHLQDGQVVSSNGL